MAINWSGIQPLNGSQEKGFEELCAQLARAETPVEADFRRKGIQDAGVECYCILSDGSEWGWQAKYFSTLGNSQWSQLDKSVKRALDRHSELTRYFVCVPMDRSDARIGNQQSSMQRWDNHAQKWCDWARDRNMCVEFIWWGSSELIERLSQNEHGGRRFYWFGKHSFDHSWFQARFDEAISAAGPRYTPEIHIDIPIARDLETFGRSRFMFDEVKSLARGIRNEFQYLESSQSSDDVRNQSHSMSKLAGCIEKILAALAQIEPRPVGELPFLEISGLVLSAMEEADNVRGMLFNSDREFLSQNKEEDSDSTYYRSPFRNALSYIRRLRNELENAQTLLETSHFFASSQCMILKGRAGAGKTHLLCDFAQERTEAGIPTILLMGQRFLTTEPPWAQVREHLDLSGVSLTEFIGALEASAQATGYRALLIIDALNEGHGPLVWPEHLAPFLEALTKSPWIGVLLSIRSEYTSNTIPQIPEQAVEVIHHGFAGQEYDATQAIFAHYGLEFTSTPVLHPEFQNPLLLKTVCEGLHGMNERRLPRGFHGITAIFDLYLDAVNKRLAKVLDFNPSDQLVRKSLNALAYQICQGDERWLDRHQAEKLVNGFLPNRPFGNSLYQGLLSERILTVTMVGHNENNVAEIVYISYERFADHLIADFLLSAHLVTAEPHSAFLEGGALQFISESDGRASHGLIEALSVQVPERVGQELISIVPALRNRWGTCDAFLQSVVWRRPDACLEETREILRALIQEDSHRYKALDAILTVTTIERHPLNAKYLDEILRQNSMPARDQWWSTSLHYAWGKRGAVDRLVDWASSIGGTEEPDEWTVELCSIALAWMLTTSNRFLRDRATKALVSLLTGRLDVTKRFVDRFADVDDLYVTERVYAVAYGVAMRSPDAIAVGYLAELVYSRVFSNGTPPVHILLRDYALGVVERAIDLGAELEIDIHNAKPPYNSTWPTIPDEDEYEMLKSNIRREFDEVGENQAAKRAIVFSIGSEFSDFSSYVIDLRTSWLSLRLNEEPWQFPKARLVTLLSSFNERELEAYDKWSSAREKVPFLVQTVYVSPDGTEELGSSFQANTSSSKLSVEELEQASESAYQNLKKILFPHHLAALEEIWHDQHQSENRLPPRFSTDLIRRYVLFRIFDLGWTMDRFGEFDRHVNEVSYSRDAAKPERIGKKYQWIAYHEVLAYIADHYQFLDEFCEDEGSTRYEGGWQVSIRDIDPSCTLRSVSSNTTGEKNLSQPWWCPVNYDNWKESLRHRDWIANTDDLPNVERFLRVTDQPKGICWLNADGHFSWRQPHPPNLEPYDVERRDFWLSCTGYFLEAGHSEILIDWAKGIELWDRWRLEPDESHEMFLGECVGSSAFRYFSRPGIGIAGWKRLAENCPVRITPATMHYSTKFRDYDCSVEDPYTLRLPVHRFVECTGIRWLGNGVDFVDSKGHVAAFDPTARQEGPSSFLLREDILRQYLSEEGLEFCWTIFGEKSTIGGSNDPHVYQGAMRIKGIYSYMDGQLSGFMKFHPDFPDDDDAD